MEKTNKTSKVGVYLGRWPDCVLNELIRSVNFACEQLLFTLTSGKLVYVLHQPSVGFHCTCLFRLLPVTISTAAPERQSLLFIM